MNQNVVMPFEESEKMPLQPEWAKKPLTTEQKIERRIAEKDANFYVLNASNVAGEIVAALIGIGDSNATTDTLKRFEELRDDIIKSNLIKAKELQ